MFAIIRTGGKQYRVSPGDSLKIEKLKTPAGKSVEFSDVLLVSDKDTTIGTPLVTKAKVSGTVVKHAQGDKVTGYKFHNKVRYTRKLGHRQEYTEVKIEKISV